MSSQPLTSRAKNWLTESAPLPCDIREDIRKNLTPGEKRTLMGMSMSHGLRMGLAPLLLVLVFLAFRSLPAMCAAVLIIAVIQGFLYVSTKRKLNAFFLSTAHAQSKGYAAQVERIRHRRLEDLAQQ